MRSVPAEALEKFVVERLKELSTDETEINKIVCQANSRRSEMLRKIARDKRQLSRQHQAVMQKLDSLVKAVESGGAETFKRISERMGELEAERAELEEQIKVAKYEACRIEEETLSAETMAGTFKTFGEIIAVASPERLKAVIPLIVEVIEWHEDREHPGSGHCRIAHFEQPRLNIKKEPPAEKSGVICSAGGADWLPGPDSNQRLGG